MAWLAHAADRRPDRRRARRRRAGRRDRDPCPARRKAGAAVSARDESLADPPRAGRWAARRDPRPGRAGRSRRCRRLCRAEGKIAGRRVGRLQSGAPDAGDGAAGLVSIRSNKPPFANRISAHGPDGVTTISSPSSAPPIANSGNRRRATGRPAAKVLSIRSIAREAGLALLPAGDAVLVVHSGTIRAVLAIALDLAPDSALRFVIDPLSLTRIDRLADGWRVVAVNQRSKD